MSVMDVSLLRKLVPWVILATLVISTGTSGCISSSDQQEVKMKAYISELHNVTLEKAANMTQGTYKLTRWNETWIDKSTINVQSTIENSTFTQHANQTFQLFRSTDDASAFVKNKKSGYVLKNASYPVDGAYVRLTGYKPSVFNLYSKADTSAYQQSDWITSSHIIQLDDIATWGSYTINAIGMKINSVIETQQQIGNYNATPDSGTKFVVVNATVFNNAVEKLELGGLYSFALKTTDGNSYGNDDESLYLANHMNSVSSTMPGEKVNGAVVFQIPQNAKPAEIIYDDHYHRATVRL